MTRYRAHFTPEAWVRDYAIEVDAEGPQEWDATAWALAHPDYLVKLDSWAHEYEPFGFAEDWGVTDRWDFFKDDPAAPEWVRLHRGPFTITIFREEE